MTQNTKIAVTDRQREIGVRVAYLSIHPDKDFYNVVWEVFQLGQEYEKEAKS